MAEESAWRCFSRNEDLTCWCFKGGFPYLLGVPNDREMWQAEALNQCDAEAVCGCGTGAIVSASADSMSLNSVASSKPVVMAVHHELTLELHRSRTYSDLWQQSTCVTTWGGKGGPTTADQRETLWQQFFTDPSQWWDCRPEKVTERYPDFKHKETQDALWLLDL